MVCIFASLAFEFRPAIFIQDGQIRKPLNITRVVLEDDASRELLAKLFNKLLLKTALSRHTALLLSKKAKNKKGSSRKSAPLLLYGLFFSRTCTYAKL